MWARRPSRSPTVLWRRARGGKEYCMSTSISVQEAQTQLPQLIARTVQDAEPCYIESNGKAVAVLVSLRQWQQRKQGSDAVATAAKAQERRVRAYQKRMQ